MPRFKSAVSGVIVEVSEETAELIGSEWEPEKPVRVTKKSE